jgi:hypothetical protein
MTPKTLLLPLLLATPALAVADALEDDAAEAAPAPEHGKAATADASPVDRGALEAELGYTPVWNNRGGRAGFDVSDAGRVHALTGTLTYGAAPDVDVKLAGGFGSAYDAAHEHADGSAPRHGGGLTDVAVGARWRFLNLAERALELAVTADAVIPAGARHTATQVGLTQDFWSARGALVATKDFGALTANAEVALGAPVSGDAGGLRSLAQVNAAVGYQLREWLQPELELNYQHQASLGPDAQVLAVTAGVVAPFGAGHRVVAAVQQGVWGRNTVQTTAAVLSFKTAL